MGFDPIMMALSNDYTDSKQLAKIEKTIFTWDGDTTGKTTIEGGEEDNNACKISDNLIDVEKAKLVKLRIFNDKSGMDFMELDIEDIYENKELLPLAYGFSVEGLEEIKTLLAIFYQDMEGFSKGVYFGYGDGWHVRYAEFETIHPIDPKFISGDYVVDLDALGFTADAVVDGVELPVEVGEALKRTASTYGGIVVKLNGSVHRLPNFFSAEGLNEYIWGGGFFTGEIIWISAHFEPEDNYFVLVDTPLMSAASEEKLDV